MYHVQPNPSSPVGIQQEECSLGPTVQQGSHTVVQAKVGGRGSCIGVEV